MPATKEKNGTYTARYYVPDVDGISRQKKKRGFKTKAAARRYEAEQIAKKKHSPGMSFESLCEIYLEDLSHRYKESTMQTKSTIIETKILTHFKKIEVQKITPAKIREWQAKMMTLKKKNGEKYSETYLHTLNSQLSAILNYAARFYNLSENPVSKAGSIGKKHAEEMEIWTVAEFRLFEEEAKVKPISALGFRILYWTGMRVGELLALTVDDVYIHNNKLNINKSYQRINKRDVITPPKTPKSKRRITISDDLLSEIREHISRMYHPRGDSRLFPFTKYVFERDIKIFAEKAGVKRIRVHDLRHSHASLLLHSGMDIAIVSARLGHENIETTWKTYAHAYDPDSGRVLSMLNDLQK